jgi:hypothetical protein
MKNSYLISEDTLSNVVSSLYGGRFGPACRCEQVVSFFKNAKTRKKTRLTDEISTKIKPQAKAVSNIH